MASAKQIIPIRKLIPVDNINICIVGCVSAGKSTILNAMFCQDLYQSKIKRTTMMPPVFVETNSPSARQSPTTIPDVFVETKPPITKQSYNKTRKISNKNNMIKISNKKNTRKISNKRVRE